MVSGLTVATHILLPIIAALAFSAFYVELLFVKDSAADNARFKKTDCTVLDLICSGNNSIVYRCFLFGQYVPDDTTRIQNFTIDEFGELTWGEVIDTYIPGGETFECYYNSAMRQEVIIEAPVLTRQFILVEYCLSISTGIIVGYLIKYAISYLFEKKFTPSPDWEATRDEFWDSKHRENQKLPFNSLLMLDLAFAVILFTFLSFVDEDSLNHSYGFLFILLFAIFGGFEKYPNPSPLLTPSCKLTYLIGNISLAFSWSVITILSKIVLCFLDPFPRLRSYLVSIFAFAAFLTIKSVFAIQFLFFLQMYYSNTFTKDKDGKKINLRSSLSSSALK